MGATENVDMTASFSQRLASAATPPATRAAPDAAPGVLVGDAPAGQRRAAPKRKRPTSKAKKSPKKPAKDTTQKSVLGRVTALGPQEPWQVALLMPNGWDDLTRVLTRFDPEDVHQRLGENVVLRGRLSGQLQIHYQPVPRVQGVMIDADGQTLRFTIFGNTGDNQKQILQQANNLCVRGRVDEFMGEPNLTSAEVISPAWAGRLRPRYPGKKSVIGSDKVRQRVMANLRDAIAPAADYVRQTVADGDVDVINDYIRSLNKKPVPVEKLLRAAHCPKTEATGYWAQHLLQHLSAITVAKAARKESNALATPRWMLAAEDDWAELAQNMPFELNSDQQQAVDDILADLRRPAPMHRLLSGDVGTGKTAVYALAAAVAVRAGARVAVLAPNTGLVQQIAAEIQGWWPDLGAVAVTGATDTQLDLARAPVLVGTTALLHRQTGDFDLVVVDEQHKFSRAQREQLRASGCHLLEATATCTPRSRALMELGINATSRLTQRPQTNRQVATRLWSGSQRRELMSGIEATLAAGDQVLVIYPERGDADEPDDGDAPVADIQAAARQQAGKAFEIWERRFPGQARLIHGAMTNDDKVAALDAMRSGDARILISTTVVEVGIDLPELMRAVVIKASQLGLVSLHQIRGRVARKGGAGHFDLFVPVNELDPTTPAAKRLKVLCETDDGFVVSERDMHLRGFGDLSKVSTAEKGFLDGLLFRKPVTAAHIERAIEAIDRFVPAESAEAVLEAAATPQP